MAADLSAKKAAFVSRLVGKVGVLLDAIDSIQNERKEWDELGYSSDIGDDDMGNNHQLVAADLSACMNSIDAINTLRAAGHGTNLQKMRP